MINNSVTKQGDLLQLIQSHECYANHMSIITKFKCKFLYVMCSTVIFVFDMDNESNECVLISEDFFATCLLLEVLGHWCTGFFVSSVYECPIN